MDSDDAVYLATTCEQIHRYDDMISYIKSLPSQKQTPLTPTERNLFASAYKNAIGRTRQAWRALTSFELANEKKKGSRNHLIKNYKSKIENELSRYCHDILQILNAKLVLTTKLAHEDHIFYLKLKGDYNRYMAEYKIGEAHTKSSVNAELAYNEANQ
jgi:14-3-3 protein epsilon